MACWVKRTIKSNMPNTNGTTVKSNYTYNGKQVYTTYFEWTITGSTTGTSDINTGLSLGPRESILVLNTRGSIIVRDGGPSYNLPWVKQTVTFNVLFDNSNNDYVLIASSNNTAWMNNGKLRIWVDWVNI